MARFNLHQSKTWNSYKQHWNYLKLCYKSLTYNSIDTFAESVFEPLYCIVEFIVRWLGLIFVSLVICLIAAVVIIFYKCILPYILDHYSAIYAFFHLLYGHYLLLMICFHYFQAVTTKSGKPLKDITGVPVTCICKKCFLPKPPRTHHCNVCKSCQLKMDHHCPWLNNCVGHFNHRYFISFCIFMCLGTIYVTISSWKLFQDCFHLEKKVELIKFSFYKKLGYQVLGVKTPSKPGICIDKSKTFSSSVIFLWILCCAVTFSLGGLTLWHSYLITIGETSIERLINKKEKRRLKTQNTKFVNPYNYGPKENWKQLLGCHSFRSFIRRVILPSTHLPHGDGIIWTRVKEKVFVA